MNLAGGGLQSANIRLAQLLKRRPIAYALLLLFPIGAHRAYLEDRRGALLYCVGSAAAVLSLALGAIFVGWALAAALAGWALFDAWWIERAVVRINKRLRMEVYMSQTAGAPAGYQGRFTDEGASPDNTRGRARTPSFSEQERRLRSASDEHGRQQ